MSFTLDQIKTAFQNGTPPNQVDSVKYPLKSLVQKYFQQYLPGENWDMNQDSWFHKMLPSFINSGSPWGDPSKQNEQVNKVFNSALLELQGKPVEFDQSLASPQKWYTPTPGGNEYQRALNPNDQTVQIANSSSNPTTLPFKTGLTDVQKTQIVNRINRIAAGDPITATDQANFGYALGPNFASYIPQAPQQQQQQQQQQGGSENQSNLPPSINGVLDAVTEHLTNSVINPDTTIDQSVIDGYLEQAKQELGPYYKQLFDQAAADLKTGMTRIGEDLSSAERTLQSKYASDLETTQENMAKRGLTFSSNRDKAERTLADTTQAAIEAGRQKAYRDAFDLGTKGERLLGSSKFPTDLPNTIEAPTPILNQPGVYAFSTPKTTRNLFDPVGGQVGTNEQEELAATKKRQIALQNNELNYRSLSTI